MCSMSLQHLTIPVLGNIRESCIFKKHITCFAVHLNLSWPFWTETISEMNCGIFHEENNRYIVLNPESWNILRLIDVLCGQSNNKLSSGRFQLDTESLDAILTLWKQSMTNQFCVPFLPLHLHAVSSTS